MTFTFNAAIPQASDFIDDSQGDLLNNNIAINGIFSRNHSPFVDVTANQGKHTFVEMLNNTNIPAGLASSTGTIYVKTASSISDLYYSNDNSTREYQLTNVLKNADAAKITYFGKNINILPLPTGTTQNIGGFTFLPGGLLMQYGSFTHTSNATTVLTFPITFSAAPFSIWGGGEVTAGADPNARATVGFFLLATTGFSARTTTNSDLVKVYWTAIGPY